MVSIEYLDNVLIAHALKYNESSRTFKELIRVNFDKSRAIIHLEGNEALFYTKVPVSMDSILYIVGVIDTGNLYPKECEAVLLKVNLEEETKNNFMTIKMMRILLYDLKRKVSDEYEVGCFINDNK